MKARYFVRVQLPTHWSCIAVIGPGQGSRAVANNVRDILLAEPGWTWPVRVQPTRSLPPHHRGGQRRAVERAERQAREEWDALSVAVILNQARAGRKYDRRGLPRKAPA